VKFAKYLQRFGCRVHVLAAENLDDQASPWQLDADELQQVTRISYRVFPPYYLRKPVDELTILTKLIWKLSYWGHRAREIVFNSHPQDPSVRLSSRFRKEARAILEREHIDFFIASGGPWRYVYELSKLRTPCKTRFIADFRDYWTDGTWFQGLPRRLKQHESALEQKVVETADIVVSPTDRILERLASRAAKDEATLFVELGHAYDPDDFCVTHDRAKFSQPVRMVYFGTLYANLDQSFDVLLQWFADVEHFFGVVITLDIFTTSQDYLEMIRRHPTASRVQLFHPLTPHELGKRLFEEYHYAIYITEAALDNANFCSTKFADIMGAGKPILYIGPEGLVSEYIRREDCGFVLSPNDIASNREIAGDFACRAGSVYDAMATRDWSGWSYLDRTWELVRLLRLQLETGDDVHARSSDATV
jgi:hypothetical protein